MTWYAVRAGGAIAGLCRCPQPQANGTDLTDGIPLADDDPEILAFLNPPAAGPAVLEADCVMSFNAGEPVGTLDAFKVLKAVAISNLAARLSKPPGQVTAQEFATERDRIANIYKAL